MIEVALCLIGLCIGSFVNAVVWRLHEQAKEAKKKQPDKQYLGRLSIKRGRSMCPHCKQELQMVDLIPVISWLSLAGKCRYCRKPISIQYPLVELLTGVLFALSYVFWPLPVEGLQLVLFGLWLVLLGGFMALIVYDFKWFLLPNRLVYPLSLVAGAFAVINILDATEPLKAALNTLLAVLVGGGIFHLIFQLSNGKLIGGGDVKLGWLLGLVAGTPARSFLFIFLASVLGSVASLPLVVNQKLKLKSKVPFGPFLIIGAILVQLFGADILSWYRDTFVNY